MSFFDVTRRRDVEINVILIDSEKFDVEINVILIDWVRLNYVDDDKRTLTLSACLVHVRGDWYMFGVTGTFPG